MQHGSKKGEHLRRRVLDQELNGGLTELIPSNNLRRVLFAGGPTILGGWLAWLAWHMPTGFDEVWHLFLARQPSAWSIWTTAAQAGHPPLFPMLLGFAQAVFGPTPVLFPRLFSIVCSLASLLMFHRICAVAAVTGVPRMIGILGLAGTPAFFSTAIAARGYALSQVLVLAGFWCVFSWLARIVDDKRQPANIHSWLRWGSGALLCACATHLSVWFLVAGLMAAVVVCEPRMARGAMRSGRVVAMATLVTALMAIVSSGAMRSGVLDQHGYLAPFLYRGDEPAVDFLWRNARIEASVLLPWVDVESPLAALLIPLLCLVLATVAVVARSGSGASRVRRVVLMMPVFVLAGIVAASLLGRYPFGGQGRHQLVLVTSCWLALAMLVAELRTKAGYRLRAALAVFITLSGLVNLYQARDVGIDPAFWYPKRIREVDHEIKARRVLVSTPLMATALYGLLLDHRIVSSEPVSGMVGDLRLRRDGVVYDSQDAPVDARIMGSPDVPRGSWSVDLASPEGIQAIRNLIAKNPDEEITWIQERTGKGPGPDAVIESFRAQGIAARMLALDESVEVFGFKAIRDGT